MSRFGFAVRENKETRKSTADLLRSFCVVVILRAQTRDFGQVRVLCGMHATEGQTTKRGLRGEETAIFLPYVPA